MESVSLEKGLELKRLSEVCLIPSPGATITTSSTSFTQLTTQGLYESSQLPWTWHGSKVVPGGLIMGLAANAAYETVTPDFSIDTLVAHFLNGPDPTKLLQLRVQQISDGGRFCARVVSVEQAGITMVHIMCTFVRTSAMKGPSMTHAVNRASSQTIEKITLDDLELGRTKNGPFMKFQRLPLVSDGKPVSQHSISGTTVRDPEPTHEKPPPQALTYTSVAQISPPITINTNRMHALGIISLSDYHILDCPPTVHNLTFGLPLINDHDHQPTYPNFERNTSLNHRIQFHVHEGFRADELTYIEAMSPWTNARRAEVNSRIFSKDGMLIATCVQESYYVLKDEKRRVREMGGGGVGKL